MAEELKACPFCSCTDIGEVTINTRLEPRHRRFKVYCKACQCRTSEHKTRKEARIYWNTRAQLPSQGGEAVAWRYTEKTPEGFEYKPEFSVKRWVLPHDGWEETPLYTHPANQVAEGVFVSLELLKRIDRMYSDGMSINPELEELRQLLAKNEGGKA